MVDTILVIVTAISLAFAAAMGIIVWRTLRLEQLRSDARVAGLTAAVDDFDGESWELGLRDPGSGIRVQHGNNAWEGTSWAPPRTEASEASAPWASAASGGPKREAAVSPGSRIPGPGSRPPLWTDLVIERTDAPSRGAAADRAAAAHLFEGADSAPEGNGRRLVAGFALAAIFLAMAGAVVVSVSTPAKTAAASAAAPAPLELVSFGHVRTGGTLAIRGIVRNPVARGAVSDLTAVVFLFDKDGGYLGTLKQPVASTVLAPGAESSFEVAVSDQLPVGRYRLTFHVNQTPVAHVDRRSAPPADSPGSERATTQPRRTPAALSVATAR